MTVPETSCDDVRHQHALIDRDLVLQAQFLPLQPGNAQLVRAARIDQRVNGGVEVAVILFQFGKTDLHRKIAHAQPP